MKYIKKIILALLIVFVAIQFIQPAHNKSEQVLATDFANIYSIPDSVQTILQAACYDCHSNNTNYPWYANIQPMAWVMADHIKKGKEDLNFSEFDKYARRRKISKLKSIGNQIKDDAMPISSYKLIHKNARLSKGQKKLIIDWMSKTADSLSSVN